MKYDVQMKKKSLSLSTWLFSANFINVAYTKEQIISWLEITLVSLNWKEKTVIINIVKLVLSL